MKYFNSDAAALEYAESLSKNESEVVFVCGKRTFLTNTSIPIESHLRDRFEAVIRDFASYIDANVDELNDGIFTMGAEIGTYFSEHAEEYLGFRILSRYANF